MLIADPTVDLAAAIQSEQVWMHIPSHLDWITPTVEHLTNRAVQCGVCDDAQALKLSVALHEALTNAVVHGNLGVPSHLKEESDDAFAQLLAERGSDPAFNDRIVAIGVDFDGKRCQWTLTDQGDGFNVKNVLKERELLEEDMMRLSGRGILLMQAFMDEVRFEDDGRRVLLTLRRNYQKNQRRHPRVAVRKRVRVGPLRPDGSVDWNAMQEGISQDLSAGGISIFLKLLLRAERVVIGIEVEGQTLYIPAEIRHRNMTESGLEELGCRFLITSEAETARQDGELTGVQTAVGALLQGLENRKLLPAEDQRAHRRAPYTERIELSGPTATDPTTAIARDLSQGGIAFITTAPVTLEIKLLTLPLKNGQPLRVRARVVRCSAVAEGFYDVGACFTALG